MKKWIVIVGSAAALVVAAAAAIPLLVDPNQYKQEIAALVREKTGRELTVNGSIGLTVFPWVGVSLSDVSLGDAPGFGADPMAKVARMEVRARLMPLLSKRLEADRIAIDGLNLKLVRNAKGRANWEDLTGGASAPTAAEPSPQAPPPTSSKAPAKSPDSPKGSAREAPKEAAPATPAPTSAPTSGGGSMLAGFSIGGVEIRNAQASWSDAVSGAHYGLKGLKLETGAVTPGQPVAVVFESDVESRKPAANAHVALSATVRPSADGQSVTLQKSKLGVSLKGGEGLPVKSADLQLAAEIEAALDGSAFKLSGLDAALKTEGGALPLAQSETRLQGGVEVTPSRASLKGAILSVKGTGKPGAAFAQLEAQFKGDAEGSMVDRKFKLPALELSLKAQGGTLPGGGADLRLAASGEVDWSQQSARLAGLKLEGLDQLKVEGGLNIVKLLEDPTVSGELTLHPLNPRTLMTRLGQTPPATTDDKALTSLGLKASFKADDQRLEVSKLTAKMDETTLQGGFSLANFGLPAVRFDLSADALDLDRYLPPQKSGGEGGKGGGGGKEAGGGSGSEKAPAPSGGEGEIPVKLLRLLDVDGKVKLASLKAGGGHFQDAQLVFKAKDGLLRMEPAQVKLYSGSARVDATLDARSDTPRLAVKKELQGVKLDAMLKEMAQDESLTGVANLKVDVTSSGKSVAALKQGLNGDLAFSIKEGAYLKKDLAFAIRQAYGAYAAAKGRAMAVGQDTGRTPFTTLEGAAVIRNGVLESKNLQAVSSALKLNGGGTADLVKSRLDFTTRVNLLTALEDVDTQSMNDLRKVEIPVRIYGDLTQPQTTVDLAALLEQALKTKAMEKVQEKLDQKVQDKVGGKLQEKLGDALGKEVGDELKKILPFGR